MKLFGHELIWRKIPPSPPEEPFEIKIARHLVFVPNDRCILITAKDGFRIEDVYKDRRRGLANPTKLYIREDI